MNRLSRILLRDFIEADRTAFVRYQMNPRYLGLYDFAADDLDRPNRLFDLFLQGQAEDPRFNFQLGLFDPATGRLLGCGGLRKVAADRAVLGIELAPTEWGRFHLALDAAAALLQHGFEMLNLATIVGDTASGNRRVEKLARWFGAEIVAEREGPAWMRARGWREVDWALQRPKWEQRSGARLSSNQLITTRR